MMHRPLTNSLAVAALTMGAFGCAQTPPPHTALTNAQSSVAAAEARGAQQVPEASLYLKMAKDGVEQARGLMAEDKNKHASAVLQRARMDAELAASLATEEEVKKKAQEQLERVDSLQKTNNAQMEHSAAQG